MANLDRYPKLNIPRRLVPPGYAKSLDMGNIDFQSGMRSEKTVGFLGSRFSRDSGLRDLVEDQLRILNKSVKWTGKERTLDRIKSFVTKYPLQLNLHRKSVETNRIHDFKHTHAVEAFRVSLLVSNHACLVSTLSYPGDQQRYDRIVRFTSPSNMTNAFRESLADVRGCQERSYQEFKWRFAPTRILNQSGFLHIWPVAMNRQ
jgi:hypothetical protein